jgi:thaumarchaeosortase
MTFEGRTFYLFFLWLVSLEIILNWEKNRETHISTLKSVRTISLITSLLLPTIYVVVANYLGLNGIIMEAVKHNNVPSAALPLSTEYLVFAVLFALIILLAYGKKSLMDFSISIFFLGGIGVIYTINNLYPYGQFTPFQILVPITTTLAANVLKIMGYQTSISEIRDPYYGTMPTLRVWDPNNPSKNAIFAVAWPCAGVESLIIYTVTIPLFLKKTAIPWKHWIVYFAIGAVITYVINILRIVTLFLISINGGNITPFHDYYASLISITWIIFYPIIIIGSQNLWTKVKNWRNAKHDISESFERIPK